MPEVDKELALHDTPQRIVHALKTDRAYSASVAAEAGTSSAFNQQRPFYAGLVDWPMKRLFLGAVDYLDSQIALAGNAWPNTNARVGPTGTPQQTNLGVMADLLVPAIQASYEAEGRITAVMRSLRIFNALAQFCAENDRDASGLDELPLPQSATIDPFSGAAAQAKACQRRLGRVHRHEERHGQRRRLQSPQGLRRSAAQASRDGVREIPNLRFSRRRRRRLYCQSALP